MDEEGEEEEEEQLGVVVKEEELGVEEKVGRKGWRRKRRWSWGWRSRLKDGGQINPVLGDAWMDGGVGV